MKNSDQIKNVNDLIKNVNEQIKIPTSFLVADTDRDGQSPPFSTMKAKQIFNHFIQRQHDSECVNIYRQLPQELQKEIDILTREQSIKNQIMIKEMDEQIKNMDDMLKGMDEMSRQNQILIKEMAEEHIQHEKRNEEILQEIEMYKELNRQLDVALKDNKYF